MTTKTLSHLGIEITVYASPKDGKPVIEIDTPSLSDGPDGPLCRVWINEALTHDGERIPEVA